jgi:hypothetical protein
MQACKQTERARPSSSAWWLQTETKRPIVCLAENKPRTKHVPLESEQTEPSWFHTEPRPSQWPIELGLLGLLGSARGMYVTREIGLSRPIRGLCVLQM